MHRRRERPSTEHAAASQAGDGGASECVCRGRGHRLQLPVNGIKLEPEFSACTHRREARAHEMSGYVGGRAEVCKHGRCAYNVLVVVTPKSLYMSMSCRPSSSRATAACSPRASATHIHSTCERRVERRADALEGSMLPRADVPWAALARRPPRRQRRPRGGGAEHDVDDLASRRPQGSSATFPSLGNRHHATRRAGGITGRRAVLRQV